MKFVSLVEATRLYGCKAEFNIEKHLIDFPLFNKFCLLLRRFERSVGEHSEDPYWQSYLRQLRRYRFALTSAPLPGNHPRLTKALDLPLLKARQQNCPLLYPHLAADADQLLQVAQEMAENAANPIANFMDVSGLWDTDGLVALLIKDSTLRQVVERELASLENLKNLNVLNVHQIKGTNVYDRLVIIGPGHWFPEHVFLVPRAPSLFIAHYKWIWDTWNPSPVFPTSELAQRGISKFQTWDFSAEDEAKILTTAEPPVVDEILKDVELLPETDWGHLVTPHRVTRESLMSDSSEPVEARLVLLERDMCVFLEAEEGSTVLVIDLESDDEERVRRVSTDELAPGMFVLQREVGGGGDLILPLADLLLGGEARRVRDLQAAWKRRLREQVLESTLGGVSRALVAAGSPLANEANVRHWMTERSIRTHDYQDFAAIMSVVGMQQQAAECWQAMGAIAQAHRRAGHQIRKRLLRLVAAADLAKLERDGWMSFDLKDVPGGGLVAWRVTEVSPNPIAVTSAMIGEFFKA